MRSEILNKINASVSFHKIELSNMGIVDGEIQEIMETIKRVNPDISKFNLDKNKLSDEGALILSEHLYDFKNVEELSVQRNFIDKSGALAIFRLQNDFPDLDIAFNGNKISNVAEMSSIQQEARSLINSQP